MEREILVIGIIILISLFGIRISKKFKIPILIMFIFIGMIAGSEGIGGIYFDNALTAQNFGTVALMFIIFSGGFETKEQDFKAYFLPSAILATIGVVLTAVLFGVIAYYFTNLTLKEALLFGAMVSSTDAAAVMSLLEKSNLKPKLKSVVEIESGSNDPMAYILILFILSLFNSEKSISFMATSFLFIKQVLFGILFGYIFGKLTIPIAEWLKIKREELLSILFISIVFICFATTVLVDGNGYLAVYLLGIIIGNKKFNYKINSARNLKLITSLMQTGMFVMLGLLVFPTQLLDYILIGSLLSVIMILFVRVIVVYALMLPFNFNCKEKFFISWAGLKGAVPIIFSTLAITNGIPNSQVIFNLTFYIVVFSVLIQGMNLKYIAKKLNLLEKDIEIPTLEMDELEELALKKMILDVNSEYINKKIRELNLPPNLLIISIKRGKSYITPKGDTTILEGDTLLFSEN